MRSKLALSLLTVALCNFGLLAQDRSRGEAKEPARKDYRPTDMREKTRSVRDQANEHGRSEQTEDGQSMPRKEPAGEPRSRDGRQDPARDFLQKHPGVAKHLKEKFDANADGQLDETERERAKAWLREEHERRAEERRLEALATWNQFQQEHPAAAKRISEKADTNGDGKVDDDERRAAMQHLREARGTDRDARERWQTFEQKHPEVAERMKERADRNDDGKVDWSERKEVREWMEERREDRRELREDRREVRDDRREIRDDRRDLREDLRDGDRKEVRKDVKELREDHQELREDRRDRREDRRDLHERPAPKPQPQPKRR